MDADKAEIFIVNLLRESKLSAKVDVKNKLIRILHK